MKFPQPAFNKKFEGVTTEELLKELLDRRQAYIDQLSSVAALFSAAPALPSSAPPAARPVAAVRAQDGQSLNERILETLREAGRPLRTNEFPALLVDNGWTTTAPDKRKLVSSYLSALVKSETLKRHSNGTVSLADVRPRKRGRPRKGAKRGAEGKRTADYLLDALAEVGQPCKPVDLLPIVQRAGWSSSSPQPVRVLETTLRILVTANKVKALGKSTFEAVA